ncbi:DUF1569 domain-containing protein [uncultured Maribacter sp.]|uniref:DUF1569 domain-containing protein n=1 Tax=uncultured Maribacter sp. TaxID=431308 RepID=UPI00260E5228|nr:DUF1569 domain-containing protein [uncultured Maribacter sp.]
MKSLFEEKACNEILDRINSLKDDSQRQWGKMSLGQMAWHCQFPLKIAIKNKDTGKKGNLFVRLFFKKSAYNNKVWRRGLPTAPALKTGENKNASIEIEKLKTLVKEFNALKNREEWQPHPFFGTLTHEQWGKMEYKHLDHHLRQFNV